MYPSKRPLTLLKLLEWKTIGLKLLLQALGLNRIGGQLSTRDMQDSRFGGIQVKAVTQGCLPERDLELNFEPPCPLEYESGCAFLLLRFLFAVNWGAGHASCLLFD